MNTLLRTLAALGLIVLPLAWLLSLRGEPDLLQANVFRTLGAAVGAVAASMGAQKRSPGTPWTGCLAGGIAGSLVISALSLLLPVLGQVTMAGWLTSGVVGGGVVALSVYVVRGPSPAAR